MGQNEEKHSLTRLDIEQHLQSALAAATPNVWSKLDLSVPQDKPADVPGLLRLERKLRHWGAAAACICLIAAGGIYHYEYLQVVSIVGIDVNPSLCLSLNRRDTVLKAEALNTDGEKVLDGELKGKTLESAVGQVVNSLVEKGYLKEGQQEQAVLVSVSGKSEKKAEKVRSEVTVNMETAISQNQVSAVVYDQTIQVTKELEELAEVYQVSVGKAGFVEQLVQENEDLSQDPQAAYAWMMSQSMETIAQEICENAYSVSPRVSVMQVEPEEAKDSRSEEYDGKGSQEDSERETVGKEAEDKKRGEKELQDEIYRESSHENGKEEAQPGIEDTEETKVKETQENPAAQKETRTEKTKPGKTSADTMAKEEPEDGKKAEPTSKDRESQAISTEAKEPAGEATSSTVEAKKPEQKREEAENTDKADNLEEAGEISEETEESREVTEEGLEEGTEQQEEKEAQEEKESQEEKETQSEKESQGEKENQGDKEIQGEKESQEEQETLDEKESQEENQEENEIQDENGSQKESHKAKESAADSSEEHLVKYGQLVTDEVGVNVESGESEEKKDTEDDWLSADKDREETEKMSDQKGLFEEGDVLSDNLSDKSGTGIKAEVEKEEPAGREESPDKEEAGAAKSTAESAEKEELEAERTDKEKSQAEREELETERTDREKSEAEREELETERTDREKSQAEREEPEKEEAGRKEPEQEGMLKEGSEPEETLRKDSEPKEAAREEIQETQEIEEEKSGNEAEKAEIHDKPAEESAQEVSAQEDREGISANQIIRVKVEKKEWKEPKEPVYASQLLGFSQRRLLCRGPGAFEFIIANPEQEQEEDDLEAESEEEIEQEEAEEERFPDPEDELDIEGEWEADMGEWLHIGPGYSSNESRQVKWK